VVLLKFLRETHSTAAEREQRQTGRLLCAINAKPVGYFAASRKEDVSAESAISGELLGRAWCARASSLCSRTAPPMKWSGGWSAGQHHGTGRP